MYNYIQLMKYLLLLITELVSLCPKKYLSEYALMH